MARVRDALRPERPGFEPRRDDRPAAALERDGFRPERTGADIGPDAYVDNGRGPASDRHGFRSERASLEPERPGWDRDRSGGSAFGGGNSLLDRPRGLHADGMLDRPRELRVDSPLDRPRGLPGETSPRRSGILPDRAGDRGDPQSAGRDRAGAVGDGIGPVPGHRNPDGQASPVSGDRDDDTLTRPLPRILPGATTLPRPEPVEAPRGPFEPARPSQPSPRPASVTGSVEPPPATFSGPVPPPAPAARAMPEAAVAKLDQIKDLYLTAEAIGEDALDKHFDQVSQRQRELIREFFDRSKPGGGEAER